MKQRQLRAFVAKKELELEELKIFMKYWDDFSEYLAISERTCNDVMTKASSKMAQIEISIRDHRKLIKKPEIVYDLKYLESNLAWLFASIEDNEKYIFTVDDMGNVFLSLWIEHEWIIIYSGENDMIISNEELLQKINEALRSKGYNI